MCVCHFGKCTRNRTKEYFHKHRSCPILAAARKLYATLCATSLLNNTKIPFDTEYSVCKPPQQPCLKASGGSSPPSKSRKHIMMTFPFTSTCLFSQSKCQQSNLRKIRQRTYHALATSQCFRPHLRADYSKPSSKTG